jgi:DNA-3-methyladenine glycosylase II
MADRRPDTTTVTVRFSRSIDVHASVAPLGRWGDDLLDRFEGHTLVRTIQLAPDGRQVPYRSDIPQQPTDAIEIEATSTDARGLEDELARRVSATFVDGGKALVELAARDEAITQLVARYPGLVPVLIPDPFAALVRSISAQQINLRWAAVIRHRLAEHYGRRLTVGDDFVHVLDPLRLANARVDDLRGLQLTYAKARAVVATARAATSGELRIADLERLDDEAVIAHLTRLPGIGRWSAEWFLARTLGRPRVVAGDLGVRKAIGRLYGAGMPSEVEVRRLTEHWGDAATVAQALALQELALSPGPAPAR